MACPMVTAVYILCELEDTPSEYYFLEFARSYVKHEHLTKRDKEKQIHVPGNDVVRS
jgi:hypothetical protein